MIVNLTGHPLKLTDGIVERNYPSNGRARVDSSMRQIAQITIGYDGQPHFVVPVLEITESEVVGLPEQKSGIIYVVSGIVAANVIDRPDVLAPGRMQRGKNGVALGAKALLLLRNGQGEE